MTPRYEWTPASEPPDTDRDVLEMNLDELERLEREATAGPWIGAGPSFGDPLPRYTTEIVTEWQSEEEESQTICLFGISHRDDENEANAHLIAALRNSARELIADARRYRWLKERLHGVDFNYMDADNRANSVIVFKIDDEVRMSGNLDLSIDAAIAQEQK